MSSSESSSSTSLLTLAGRIIARLSTAIYADTSQNDRISVGLLGGEIPIFPPLAFLLTTILGLLVWRISGQRVRFLPSLIGRKMTIRMALMAVGLGTAFQLASAAKLALEAVDTSPDFAPVSAVATHGPYTWTRNGMYWAVFLIQISVAVALDSAWVLGSVMIMIMYLDRVVVPAEERFLTEQLGEDYQRYCETVPRWL